MGRLKRNTRFLRAGIFTAVIVSLAIGWLAFDRSGPAKSQSVWSETVPALNITHIFQGEINRRGKPVGFHVPPPKDGYPASRIKEILSGPNKSGVSTAIVEIFDPAENKWKEKFSSLFPSTLSKPQIITAILKAAANTELGAGSKWKGKSEYGFTIEGYRFEDGAINTAYPIYIAD